MRRSRRGQGTTEYMLLMCAMLVVLSIVGNFLKSYVPQLAQRLTEQIAETALSLARPY